MGCVSASKVVRDAFVLGGLLGVNAYASLILLLFVLVGYPELEQHWNRGPAILASDQEKVTKD